MVRASANPDGAGVAEPEPGGRAPAPGRVRLVQQFLNTNDMEARADQFTTVAGLRRWLVARSLLGPGVRFTDADRRRAVEVREAIRALIVARDAGVDATAATRRLETAAVDASLRLRIRPDGWDLVPRERRIAAALGRILVEVTAAMADGSWVRLKACRRDACRWVFWDASRNRSGSWCEMSICGNRIKSAAFRTRRRAA